MQLSENPSLYLTTGVNTEHLTLCNEKGREKIFGTDRYIVHCAPLTCELLTWFKFHGINIELGGLHGELAGSAEARHHNVAAVCWGRNGYDTRKSTVLFLYSTDRTEQNRSALYVTSCYFNHMTRERVFGAVFCPNTMRNIIIEFGKKLVVLFRYSKTQTKLK